MVAAGDAEGKDTAEDEDGPDHGDFGEWWAEELRGERSGVYGDAVHADYAVRISIEKSARFSNKIETYCLIEPRGPVRIWQIHLDR